MRRIDILGRLLERAVRAIAPIAAPIFVLFGLALSTSLGGAYSVLSPRGVGAIFALMAMANIFLGTKVVPWIQARISGKNTTKFDLLLGILLLGIGVGDLFLLTLNPGETGWTRLDILLYFFSPFLLAAWFMNCCMPEHMREDYPSPDS